MASTTVGTRTVIVADDTEFVRARFRTALEAAGHRAIAVGTGAALIDQLKSAGQDIDLIVLDLRLPDRAGADLIRAIRSVETGCLSILVLSGTIASANEVRELASLGVAGYVNEYIATQHILPSLAPYLFPDTFNRRGSPRVSLAIPIQYQVGSTIAAALTLDVGRGGLAIRTTSPLDAGAQVHVRFRLPGTKQDTNAEGRVAWSDRRVGMGTQFEQLDPACETGIDNFVDAHFFSSRKA
jgi:uncharacterized protein (TIGR02266 family)